MKKSIFSILLALLPLLVSADTFEAVDAEVDFSNYTDISEWNFPNSWGGSESAKARLSIQDGCLHFHSEEATDPFWDCQFYPIGGVNAEVGVTYTLHYKIKGSVAQNVSMLYFGQTSYGQFAITTDWVEGTVDFEATSADGNILMQCGDYVGDWDIAYLKITHEANKTDDGFVYNWLSNNRFRIVDYLNKESRGPLIIPSTIAYGGVDYPVVKIDNTAFYGCKGLTSVRIPDCVTSIGEKAFYGCTSLATLTIGKGVKTIGESAFANCTNLSDVYCYAEEFPTTDSYYIFSGTPINQAALYIPAIHQTKYQTTSPWSSFKYILLLEGATAERCAKPTISLKDGKITFECETPEASFVSNYVPLNGSTTEGNEMTLPNLYRITVFAQKYGYLDSPAATAEVEMSLGKYGDLSGDGKVDVGDHVKLSDIILNQSK